MSLSPILEHKVGSECVRITQGGKSVRIAEDSMWPNDLLGNAVADGWLHFIYILLHFIYRSPVVSLRPIRQVGDGNP